VLRFLIAALLLVAGVLAGAAPGWSAPATDREQVLHVAAPGPAAVAGPPQAERMDVTVRGVRHFAGLSVPVGASALGHGVTAVELPADLRPDEPILVRISPASAGSARVVPLDPVIGAGLAGARVAGLMLGLFFAIILLMLATFAVTREPSIPWYLGLLASVVVLELYRDGVLQPRHSTSAAMVFALDLVATIFIVGFATAYLRLWSERRDLFWWLGGAMLVAVVIGGVGTLTPEPPPSTEAIRPLLIGMFALVSIIVVVLRARQFPPGWFFLAGMIGVSTNIMYRAVRAFTGEPFLDHWAFEAGTTIEALLFATAIIARIRYRVEERRTIEHRLTQATHDAMHDDLTGVLNRRGLFAQADQLQSGTLFAIDLDAFKSINDLYGHAAGDGVLQAVARQLRETVRDEDLVARVGGDEFVVVAPSIDQNRARAVAERLAGAIEGVRPAGVRSRVDGFGASIGYVALEGLAFEHALRTADLDAYRVKQSRRAAWRASSAE
jgi:diguanylate cyclase (GGDEF)-like protein